MKKSNIYKLGIVFVVILMMGTDSVKATITDVSILPEEPTIIDPLTIAVSGVEDAGPISITGSNFLMEDSSLELDIFISMDFFFETTPWSHSEIIGTLPADYYNLTVNAHYSGPYTGTDTYLTSFTVVPEPATALLLAIGMVQIRLKFLDKLRKRGH